MLIQTAAMGLAFACAARGDCGNGERVNIAEFARAWTIPPGDAPPVHSPGLIDPVHPESTPIAAGGSVLIEWTEPRDVSAVSVRTSGEIHPGSVGVEHWYRIWPDGGGGGWQRLDDPFNGQWVPVVTQPKQTPGGLELVFSPLERSENPAAERTGFPFRHAYKIRLTVSEPLTVESVAAYSDAVWKTAFVALEWKPNAEQVRPWPGQVEVVNGHLIRPAVTDGNVVRLRVRYSDAQERLSGDRGYIVFRAGGWDSFSVFVDDIIREGGIYVRDSDAFVSDASRDLSYSNWAPPAGSWDATIMETVARMPEQTLERVQSEMPAKPPREAHLGVANMRQEFTITPSGDIQLYAGSLRGPGRDRDRRPWTAASLDYMIGTLETPPALGGEERTTQRSLEDGWLPVLHTEWNTGDVHFHETALATVLAGRLDENEDSRRGDEPLVLLNRIDITITGSAGAEARIWVNIAPAVPMSLRDDGLIVLDHPSDGMLRSGLTAVRGAFDRQSRGALDCVEGVVRYTVVLRPGERHSVYLKLPYIELLEDSELECLVGKSWEASHADVVAYWNKRVSEGMQYETPERVLNHLWKANLWHTLITTDRDPETGLYEHGAATMRYAVFANETCMVAQSLEMRGLHDEAFRLLEPFLACQGRKGLPGNFSSREGLLYAAHPDPENDPYTAQGYNMHHGWALWKLAEHYLYVRDKDYVLAVAPSLIRACDWITRERESTRALLPGGGTPREWGLAPAGDLEDVEEYLYWYATNAYYYRGMKTTADVLALVDHPDAARIGADARRYRADILRSVKESIANAPVVRLKDGSYIPYVPPRVHVRTHLKEGWIREGLYSALHLLDGELLDPGVDVVSWVLQDLEDNIFLSQESGYGVADQKVHFFSFGGFNLQPNLCPNALAHLRRDEVPAFIRVFYNTLCASLFPDTVCFAEWVPHYGKGGGPLYKTPDECKFVQFMRDMLVLEEGRELRLGAGVPRAWMEDGKTIRISNAATFFGPMSLRISSHADDGAIEAWVTLPSRNPPRAASLRLRHPAGKPMRAVTLDGSEWSSFDAAREIVHLPEERKTMHIVASY